MFEIRHTSVHTSLIICTFLRPSAVCRLLESVSKQTVVPDEVIIVDGSPGECTERAILALNLAIPLTYFRVEAEHRGLTKQRNYGIQRVAPDTDIIAFLDDDLVLEPDYFENILDTYKKKPDAIGVGGIDVKENRWVRAQDGVEYPPSRYYLLDDWVLEEPARYRLRKKLGLMADLPPGKIPLFSHGRSSFPPNETIYEVDHFMGGIASYRREIFDKIKFSEYFQGYGLYEDFDFTVRVSRLGKIYVNTAARVWHYHEPAGRPDKFRYGKMVVRNGWYVWRQKYPDPPMSARIKWHLITLLLAFIRLGNAIQGPDRREAMSEFAGRLTAWLSLFFSRPAIEKE